MQDQLAPTHGKHHFWNDLQQKSTPITPPRAVQDMLTGALPAGAMDTAFATRRKGGGGLGRPRFLVVANLGGEPVAREAKAAVPSAWDWAHDDPNPTSKFMTLAHGPSRLPDPTLNLITLSPNRRYIIRSVSPDSHKIDVDQYANTKLDPRLLEAMAFDIGSIHAADPAILVAIQQDMGRRPSWLEAATMIAKKSVENDYNDWKIRSGLA